MLTRASVDKFVILKNLDLAFQASDETAFVTANEATLNSNTFRQQNDASSKTATVASPSPTSFLPPMSSTLTSAKLIDNDDETFRDDEETDVTLNETVLVGESCFFQMLALVLFKIL